MSFLKIRGLLYVTTLLLSKKIIIDTVLSNLWASLVVQLVKNSPAMWETWLRSLGWEDPLEKGKATHSSILAWRIPWTIHKSIALPRV